MVAELPASRPAAHWPRRAEAGGPAGVAPSRPTSHGSVRVDATRLARVHDGDSMLDLLDRVCRAAVRSLQDVQCAGVTARFAGMPFTAADTDDRVLLLDRAQFAQGDGPGLAAIRTGRRVAVSLAQARRRWPGPARTAAANGVCSFLAEPLHAGGCTVGSLNLYSARPAGIRTPDPEPALLAVLTAYLNRGLADYGSGHPGPHGAARSQNTLRDRWTVQHAVTALMTGQGLTVADAAATLRRRANDRGRPVRQIADEIIQQHVTTQYHHTK